MGNVFDMRGGSRWGHMVEKQWGSSDPLKVQGCLTPLPQAGDFIISADGDIHLFVDVKDMGTRDGFFAQLVVTNIEVGVKEKPLWDEVNDYYNKHVLTADMEGGK